MISAYENKTLDDLNRKIDEVTASRDFYKSIFDNAPIALLEEDLSDVKISIDNLRSQGVRDFEAYFEAHPDSVRQHYELIKKEVTVNREFVTLYKAESQEHLESRIDDTVITQRSLIAMKELFIALANGKTRYSTQTVDNAVDGSPMHGLATWTIAAGFEDTWERIVVSVIPFRQVSEIMAHQTHVLPAARE